MSISLEVMRSLVNQEILLQDANQERHCEARSAEAISTNKTPPFNKGKGTAELLEIASSSFLVVAMTGIECHCEARSAEAISVNKTLPFNKGKGTAELLEIASLRSQ